MAIQVEGSPNIQIPTTISVGTTAVQGLKTNKNRAGYRVIAPATNTDNVYHGVDSNVSTGSQDIIAPGGRLADEGPWDTIYRGEVWLISGTAGQTIYIEEIVKVN